MLSKLGPGREGREGRDPPSPPSTPYRIFPFTPYLPPISLFLLCFFLCKKGRKEGKYNIGVREEEGGSRPSRPSRPGDTFGL
jgi:hypothetical protein